MLPLYSQQMSLSCKSRETYHTISDKDIRGHQALLRLTANITHASHDDQANNRSKEPDDRVPNDGRSSTVRPSRAPDESATNNDWDGTEEELRDYQAGPLGRDVASEKDEDQDDGAERELPEDGVEGCPAEG